MPGGDVAWAVIKSDSFLLFLRGNTWHLIEEGLQHNCWLLQSLHLDSHAPLKFLGSPALGREGGEPFLPFSAFFKDLSATLQVRVPFFIWAVILWLLR